MRLHRLEITGFGPYPGREEVDFDALGADGLFLMHGETGAGKTTVLDAVAFALFGAVPGARGEVRRLRQKRLRMQRPKLRSRLHKVRLARVRRRQKRQRVGVKRADQYAEEVRACLRLARLQC